MANAAAQEFEFVPYISVTSSNADSARAFAREQFGGEFFKVVCMGQADPKRFKFGARQYRLFRTAAEWNRYKRDGWDKEPG